MTHDPHPRIHPDRLRELAARGRLMLCGMLAWLAEAFGGTRFGRAARALLRDDLLAPRRGVAGILILLAIPHLAPCAPQAHRPAPRGFRRARRRDTLRFAQRLLPRARGLRGQIAALAAVLDNLDLWTRRMAAHIERDRDIIAALVMTHAPADPCATLTPATPAYADSS